MTTPETRNENLSDALQMLEDAAWHVQHKVGNGDMIDALRGLRFLEFEIRSTRGAIVRDFRAQGKTWEEIGVILGVSKQAAAKMYTPAQPLPGEITIEEVGA